jgi:hypothetical protein
MSPERGGLGARAVPAEDEPWYDYRPSAKFSLRDELRLLDEARARPRPPSPATGPALPRMTHPALKHVSIQAAVTDAEPNRATNGHLAPSESQTASRQEVSPEDVQANGHQLSDDGHQLSDDGHQVNGHRVTTYNLLDSEEEVVVDRKRLLAAIICILQEELTRSKPTGG